MKATEKTVTGPTSSMVKTQSAEPAGSLLIESVDVGYKAPLGRSQKEGGYPPSPLWLGVGKGWMGRHVTEGIRGWTGGGPALSLVDVSR